MKEKILVQSLRGEYPVFVGRGLLSQAGLILRKHGLNRKVCIVTQRPLAVHRKALEQSLRKEMIPYYVHEIPEGEKAKSEQELFRLYHALSEQKFERSDTILALGGGVAGDLSGFAAATYLRGLAFVNIPTTLLAQVDSAIGGKTAINLPEGKNLVGAFYPPKVVISDIETLSTLPDREMKASLGEVVKYGIISDPELFALLEKKHRKILEKDPGLLEKIVRDSSAIKAGVVSRDEFETKGERMILNLGHTFGHGFEQATGYAKLHHGEAVAAGIIAAARLAVQMKLFLEKDCTRVVAVTKTLGLPISLGKFKIDAGSVLEAMARDKKKKSGRLRYVLPVKIGRVVVRDDVPEKLVQNVIEGVLQKS